MALPFQAMIDRVSRQFQRYRLECRRCLRRKAHQAVAEKRIARIASNVATDIAQKGDATAACRGDRFLSN